MNVTKTKTPSIDIGISAAKREKIAHGLSALLADSYTLYLMTHNFHWNVPGPMFNTLHLMFMGQYSEQWTALDLIAERIRALGHPAPGTYKEFVKLASIKEVDLPSGQSAGSHGAHRARTFSAGERCERPTNGRLAYPAPGSARKNRMDAAQSAGGLSNSE